jgi:hypothetical protein
MKTAVMVLSVMSLWAGTAFGGDGLIRRPSEPIAGKYLVVLDRRSPAESRSDAMAREAGVHRERVYRSALNGFSFSGSEQAAVALSRRPNVIAVYQDGWMHGGMTQSTPSPGLDRIDQTLLPLTNEYNYSATGSGVRIYIVDSGVNDVGDLAGRVVENVSFVPDGAGTADCAGHGTYVASIAAGTTYGVAKSAEIANVRVLGCNNFGPWSDFIAGFDYVRQQKIDHPSRLMVANASIWGGIYAPADQAVLNTVNAGVAVSLSAGNGLGDDAATHSPGRIGSSTAGAMTTGAIAPDTDTVTGYSSQGSVIDIFAPGNTYATSNSGAPAFFSGTSASAPLVAGVLATYLELFPTYSPQNLESVILQNTNTGLFGRTLGSPDRLLYTGTKRRRACCG